MPEIKDLSEETMAQDADFLLLQNPMGETYKITKANFLAGLSSGGTAAKLSGTPFGASPFFNGDSAYSFNSAFDGNNGSFYNYSSPDGGYVGLDLGTNKTITKIRYYPLSGYASRANGAILQVSNDDSTYSNIATISSAVEGWAEITLVTPITGRYFKYVGATGTYTTIAEIEVWGY